MNGFASKTILITGASSGIGKALASEFAEKSVHLVLAGRRMDELQATAVVCSEKGSACTCLFLDVASPASIAEFAEKISKQFSAVDVLINNAGISQRSKAEETTIEVDRTIMEVNFFGQVALTKALWPLLLNSVHANIVLISSVVGTFGFAQRSAYSASKHALEGFFESWMIENTHPNIFFTTVAPGRIFTNISYSALQADGTSHRQLDAGQANGISAEKCAQKIVKGIRRDKRKIYVVQSEIILIFLRKCFPLVFFRIAKKLKSV